LWLFSGCVIYAYYSKSLIVAKPSSPEESSPSQPSPAQVSSSSQLPSTPWVGKLSFQLPAATAWFDTGINLSAGQKVTIIAGGSVYIGAESDPRLDNQTPVGDPNISTSDSQFILPFAAPGLTPWSLVGRIGGGLGIGAASYRALCVWPRPSFLGH